MTNLERRGEEGGGKRACSSNGLGGFQCYGVTVIVRVRGGTSPRVMVVSQPKEAKVVVEVAFGGGKSLPRSVHRLAD